MAKGFFGFKEKQIETASKAIEGVATIAESDQAQAEAAAAAIHSVYTSGPPVERLWRPVLMWTIMGLVVARWFGFVAPGLSPEEIGRLYNFLEMGIMGYIPLRSVDKWVRGMQLGTIVREIIKKKFA